MFSHRRNGNYIFIVHWLLVSVDIYECASNPCLNNGVCEDAINEFGCRCQAGWTGDLCEIGRLWMQVVTSQSTKPAELEICALVAKYHKSELPVNMATML